LLGPGSRAFSHTTNPLARLTYPAGKTGGITTLDHWIHHFFSNGRSKCMAPAGKFSLVELEAETRRWSGSECDSHSDGSSHCSKTPTGAFESCTNITTMVTCLCSETHVRTPRSSAASSAAVRRRLGVNGQPFGYSVTTRKSTRACVWATSVLR